jgi:hypothetical protein
MKSIGDTIPSRKPTRATSKDNLGDVLYVMMNNDNEVIKPSRGPEIPNFSRHFKFFGRKSILTIAPKVPRGDMNGAGISNG